MKMYALTALRFADDITVIARSADGAQFLLNGVHRFCGWSKMKIKLKKWDEASRQPMGDV